MESITENLNNNNIIEAVKGIAAVQKIDNEASVVSTDVVDGTVEGGKRY